MGAVYTYTHLSLEEAEEGVLDVVGGPPEDVESPGDHGEPLGGRCEERPHPHRAAIMTGPFLLCPVEPQQDQQRIFFTSWRKSY